jgi:hypothetical protein
MKSYFDQAVKSDLGSELKRVHSLAFSHARKDALDGGCSDAALIDSICAFVSYGMFVSYGALCIIMAIASALSLC